MDLALWQWLVAFFGAFLIGITKTGITGLGIFAVAVFALIMDPRESVGAVLPILMTADLVAVIAYRRNAVWSHLWRLFPWVVVGIFLGYLALGYIDSRQVGRMMGIILIALVIIQFVRARYLKTEEVPHALWFIGGVGILAGFTTMVANAAAPVMVLYLLAMRLPKIEFAGTAAWFFLFNNWLKVPFSLSLGLISLNSLPLDLAVAPFAIAGALFGRQLILHIDQALFENLSLVFTLLAAVKLLF
ncbi:MAG: sulfite exporter TauE/SafE family protein [Rudaea sp.]